MLALSILIRNKHSRNYIIPVLCLLFTLLTAFTSFFFYKVIDSLLKFCICQVHVLSCISIPLVTKMFYKGDINGGLCENVFTFILGKHSSNNIDKMLFSCLTISSALPQLYTLDQSHPANFRSISGVPDVHSLTHRLG